MITFLQGTLSDTTPTQIIVDVNGIGYEVLIPLSSFDKLPALGKSLRILTHLSIREDAHILYGFMSKAERDLFRLLIHAVSGIGPKIALNVLSGMNVTAFRNAVANGDIRSLSQISGLGKKTAERIVVELKDKLGASAALATDAASRSSGPSGDQRINDAVQALVALGTKYQDAFDSINKASKAAGESASVEELVRMSLKKS